MENLIAHFADGGTAWRIARKPWKCRAQRILGIEHPGHVADIAPGQRHLEVMWENVPWSRNPSRLCEACADAAIGEAAMGLMFGKIPYKWQRPSDVMPAWYDFAQGQQLDKEHVYQ